MNLDATEVFNGLQSEDFSKELTVADMAERVYTKMKDAVFPYYCKPVKRTDFYTNINNKFESVFRGAGFHIHVCHSNDPEDFKKPRENVEITKQGFIVYFKFSDSDVALVTLKLFYYTPPSPSTIIMLSKCFPIDNEGNLKSEEQIVLTRNELCFEPEILEKAFKGLVQKAREKQKKSEAILSTSKT